MYVLLQIQQTTLFYGNYKSSDTVQNLTKTWKNSVFTFLRKKKKEIAQKEVIFFNLKQTCIN